MDPDPIRQGSFEITLRIMHKRAVVLAGTSYSQVSSVGPRIARFMLGNRDSYKPGETTVFEFRNNEGANFSGNPNWLLSKHQFAKIAKRIEAHKGAGRECCSCDKFVENKGEKRCFERGLRWW